MKATEFNTEIFFHVGKASWAARTTLEFCEECDFQKVLSYNSDNLFTQNRDDKGRYCEPYITDCNGNVLVDAEDVDKKTGRLNFDNEYDTDYVCMLSDCDDDEMYAIYKSDRYMSRELREYADAWAVENGYKENE